MPRGWAAAIQAEAGAKGPMRAQSSSVAAPAMLHAQAASGLHSPAHPISLYAQGGRPWAVPPSGQARLRAEGVAAEASGDCPGHREVCSSGCLAPLGCRWARSLCPGQHQATTWKGSSVPSELPERAFLSPGGTRPALCGRLSAGREEQECFCAGSEGTEMLSPRP